MPEPPPQPISVQSHRSPRRHMAGDGDRRHSMLAFNAPVGPSVRVCVADPVLVGLRTLRLDWEVEVGDDGRTPVDDGRPFHFVVPGFDLDRGRDRAGSLASLVAARR